jgi:hypothetical protein
MGARVAGAAITLSPHPRCPHAAEVPVMDAITLRKADHDRRP